MNFISTDENTLVGIEAIDKQHKEFVKILNKLYSLKNSQDVEKKKEEMQKLEAHIKEHFQTELDLMVKYKDPGYISHKLEHERMEKKISQEVRKFAANPGTISEEFLNDLKRWFFNHLEFNDRKLAKHIKSVT